MVRSAGFTVRVEPEIKEALEKLAKDDGRTLAAYVERLIISHLSSKNKSQSSQ